ncbi:hypothetical protein [Luteimonas salinilitoris]|uniref:Esterase-like activity of phytase family protein n=1 Tax=Luteimonas salinilitoris TaxID=3237697 RepID=A0ABV4HTY0_9GAMM
MRIPLLLTAITAALCIMGCRAEPAPAPQPADAAVPTTDNAWPFPPTTLPHADGRLALAEPQPLPGAVAVAFHPARPLLAWADGETLRTLDLDNGTSEATPVGHWIADLAFSPQGDLWLAADSAQRWRDGTAACRSEPYALDRLLGVDAAGVTAASYTHGDGIGPLRRQVWIDNDCRLEHETTAPLPAGVRNAGDDPGAAPWRETLRPVHALPEALPGRIDGDRIRLDDATAIALPGRPMAVSPDGRWWVLEHDGEPALWRLDEPD